MEAAVAATRDEEAVLPQPSVCEDSLPEPGSPHGGDPEAVYGMSSGGAASLHAEFTAFAEFIAGRASGERAEGTGALHWREVDSAGDSDDTLQLGGWLPIYW